MLSLLQHVKHKLYTCAQAFIYCVIMSVTVFAQTNSQTTDSLRVREIMPISFSKFTVNQGVGSVEVDARSGACLPIGAVMIRSMCQRGQFEVYGVPGSRVLVQAMAGATSGAQATVDNISLYPPDGIVTIGANGITGYAIVAVSDRRDYNTTGVSNLR